MSESYSWERKPTLKEMVEAVKKHANTNYSINGWDHIVECWDDWDIAEDIRGCRGISGAIDKMYEIARALKGREEEVRSTAW